MRRARLIPLFLLVIDASGARAQWQSSADAGLSRITQRGMPASNAFSFGGTVALGLEHFALQSSALGARMLDGRSTGQWIATALASTSSTHGVALQGVGTLSAFGQSNLRPTTSADFIAQIRAGETARGFAVGGGAAVTSHNAVSLPSARAVGDAWWSIGDERLTLTGGLTRTRAEFGESSILVDISNRYRNFVDVGGAWRHEGSGWSTAVGGGVRGSFGPSAGSESWNSVEATAWVARNLAVTAAVGVASEDLVRGVPRSAYATMALRISSEPHLRILGRARPSGPRVSVTRLANGTRVEISGVSGTTVEVMGDFTEWTPVALERAGNSWRLDRAITTGPHRILLRIDGGEWIVPSNLPRIDDDMGGAVGLLTVP